MFWIRVRTLPLKVVVSILSPGAYSASAETLALLQIIVLSLKKMTFEIIQFAYEFL